MFHLNKPSLKNLLKSSQWVFELRDRNIIVVMRGIHEAQFSEFSRLFGHPGKRSAEQEETLLNARRYRDWWEELERSRSFDVAPRMLSRAEEIQSWWHYFAFLDKLKKCTYAHLEALRRMPGTEKFDGNLSRGAVHCLWQMSLTVGQDMREDPIKCAEKQLRMFLNQPQKNSSSLLRDHKLSSKSSGEGAWSVADSCAMGQTE